ncbi:MAG TPA: aldehyde dehydrogenase family protein, partial [Prolixibacteraceae bacterium]|nr:aldehyde dehydrogenase family protein [Prolixibacteraceae bacterium]
MALKSVNPYTDEILEEFEEYSDEQVNESIEKSVEAFGEWKSTTFDYRKNIMLEIARVLTENSAEFGEFITKEMGKPITESIAEIEKCAWVCKHYANNAEVILHREAIPAGTHISYVSYEPLGTILGIMPWNFPFWQAFRFLAPTLMAGNVVLLKHASNVQLSAKAIEDIFKKAGLPDGVFQNLVISSGKVEQVIE